MLIPLRKPASCRPKGFHGRLRGLAYHSEQTARCARYTIRRIVGMVRARARGFHMRPRVRAELPLHQGSKGQQHLSGDQETDRWLQ